MLSFPDDDDDVAVPDFKEELKDLSQRTDTPVECERADTPSSNGSTSGVCSMASSDYETPEESNDEKQESQNETEREESETESKTEIEDEELHLSDEELEPELEFEPVIKYNNRDILDLLSNIQPFAIFQATYVPKMDLINYWERRSIYHRLGPYGTADEFDYDKCYQCNFYMTVPKKN